MKKNGKIRFSLPPEKDSMLAKGATPEYIVLSSIRPAGGRKEIWKMVFGIAAGALSALLMSCSFIFSRAFIREYKDPVKLAVFSQLVMALGGVVMLLFGCIFLEIPWSGRFLYYLSGEVFFFLIGQTSFFMVLRQVEASRAASLLGLKIIVLALIAALLGKRVLPLQWVAVVFCTTAAVGMNLSGGHMSKSSVFWLLSAVTFYALCDICLTEMMLLMPGGSMLLNSFGVIGVCYTALGLAVLPFLWKYRPGPGEFKAAVPYGVLYFSAMIFLMTSFGLLDVVFGGVIQAGRGIISVLLGVILVRLGLEKSEPQVAGRIWLRRLLMSILMLGAMALYTFAAARS